MLSLLVPHHSAVSSSSRSAAPPVPPPPPNKSKPKPPAHLKDFVGESSERPLKPEKSLTHDDVQSRVAPPKSTLLRSHTINHHKGTPPVPPPRKRPESLQIYNPHSFSLDELPRPTPSTHESTHHNVAWTRPIRPIEAAPKSLQVDVSSVKQRTVSHEVNQTLVDSPYPLGEESVDHSSGRRRSVSLHGRATRVGLTAADIRPTLTPTSNHLKHLKALELGLRQDGRELVKDVKEGWASRHGRAEERMRLVDKSDIRPNLWSNDHQLPRKIRHDHVDKHSTASDDEEGWTRLD